MNFKPKKFAKNVQHNLEGRWYRVVPDINLYEVLNISNKEPLNLKNHFCSRDFPRALLDSPLPNQEIESQIINTADKACAHIFNLLGSGDVSLGPEISWHKDFKTQFSWDPKEYHKKIRIPYNQADIKVPWELSRFYHAIHLGEAYWVTGYEKYAREFVMQIDNWIEKNEVRHGVNWKCTMEVAIRACNWIMGFYFFRKSPQLTPDFMVKFLKNLYKHGQFIKNNLEFGKAFTSNHYLSNLTGLLYLGIMFPEFKDSKSWKNFAIEGLKKEMQKQVYPDGCDFEASTCYHRLALELFFFSTFITIINDPEFKEINFSEITQKIFGKEFKEKLYKMFEAVLYLLKPNGYMPQLGDNDSGRLHIFMPERRVLDMRYLLTLGAIFFKEPKFKIKEFGSCPEASWVLGNQGMAIWENLKENSLENVHSYNFPNSGWYIMRAKKNYIIISCGPNGQHDRGGHAHNDKLSFELSLNGEDILVDPGTYTYTLNKEWRNQFRSTQYHNTVMVDNKEQNEYSWNDASSLFHMANNTHARVTGWRNNETFDYFKGEHSGYRRLPHPVIHQREIKFYKESPIKIKIFDQFLGKGEHLLRWNFTLSPKLKSQVNFFSEQLIWGEEEGYYSPEYGIKEKTKRITAQLKTSLPVGIEIMIQIQN